MVSQWTRLIGLMMTLAPPASRPRGYQEHRARGVSHRHNTKLAVIQLKIRMHDLRPLSHRIPDHRLP